MAKRKKRATQGFERTAAVAKKDSLFESGLDATDPESSIESDEKKTEEEVKGDS